MPLHRRGGPSSLRHFAARFVAALMVLGLATPVEASAASAHAGARSLGVIDPTCRGGAGAVISAPRSWMGGPPSVVTTILPSGVTLLVVSAGYPAATYVVLKAFTPSCSPDTAFGEDGTERLSFGRWYVSVAAALPTRGGVLLAGGAWTGGGPEPIGPPSGWLVARVGGSGRFDPAFGKGGWTVLPWPGSASALTETVSGSIVLGGSEGSGCCVRAWVGEVNGRGAIVTRFGPGGRVRVQMVADDWGIGTVAEEPNGEILAMGAGGNMGYWVTTVFGLTADGAAVPGFQRNFDEAMQHVWPSHILLGGLVLHRRDFLLVGTGQSRPVTNVPDPKATGLVLAFRPNGQLDKQFAGSDGSRFSSPMDGSVWVLPQRDGSTLVAGMTAAVELRPQARASLRLVDISADGKVERSYAQDGVAQIELPFLNDFFGSVSLTTNGQRSVMVTSSANGQEFLLQQLLG